MTKSRTRNWHDRWLEILSITLRTYAFFLGGQVFGLILATLIVDFIPVTAFTPGTVFGLTLLPALGAATALAHSHQCAEEAYRDGLHAGVMEVIDAYGPTAVRAVAAERLSDEDLVRTLSGQP